MGNNYARTLQIPTAFNTNVTVALRAEWNGYIVITHCFLRIRIFMLI